MSTDYTQDMLDAAADIKEAGRRITVIKREAGTDPLRYNGNEVSVDTYGVMVSPSASYGYLSAATTLNGQFADCTNVAIIAGDGINEFDTFTLVVDRGDEYKINKVDKLDVGNIAILYFLGLVK